MFRKRLCPGAVVSAQRSDGAFFHLVANEAILCTREPEEAFRCYDLTDARELVEALVDSCPDEEWHPVIISGHSVQN